MSEQTLLKATDQTEFDKEFKTVQRYVQGGILLVGTLAYTIQSVADAIGGSDAFLGKMGKVMSAMSKLSQLNTTLNYYRTMVKLPKTPKIIILIIALIILGIFGILALKFMSGRQNLFGFDLEITGSQIDHIDSTFVPLAGPVLAVVAGIGLNKEGVKFLPEYDITTIADRSLEVINFPPLNKSLKASGLGYPAAVGIRVLCKANNTCQIFINEDLYERSS